MKTSLVLLLFLCSTRILIGQSTEHLSFKGVPIDGKLVDYVNKMKNNGFQHLGTKDGAAILKGDFAGYKGCVVGVSTLKQNDLVYNIAVLFPELETWSALYNNYNRLKEMLTEKYGTPADVVEKFEGNAEPSDDNGKIYAVKFDNCKYYSVWQTNNGEIQLAIDHSSVKSCFVKLAYFDKINGRIIRNRAKDDL